LFAILNTQNPKGGYMSNSRKKFTLLEMLMVITVIAVLIALLFPALRKARESAHLASCASNLSQLAKASSLFIINESKGSFSYQVTRNDARNNWEGALFPYLNLPSGREYEDSRYNSISGLKSKSSTYRVFKCPADDVARWSRYEKPYARSYFMNSGTDDQIRTETGLVWSKYEKDINGVPLGYRLNAWGSRKITDVTKPSTTFQNLEAAPVDNNANSYAVVGDPNPWVSMSTNILTDSNWNRPYIHSKIYGRNLQFVDGSVRFQSIRSSSDLAQFTEVMVMP
jgi:competence protein ComGC